ncbi:MAG: cell division protein ZapA [Lachnospiraceae bacterium]|nr:cell division protein ZapA [Lachnospiraceae bacterium]
MNNKNSVEVIINNKIYTICGFESEEYIQRIASYINSKYTEFKALEGYNSLSTEMRNIMLEINLADDYFKAKNQIKEIEIESEEKNKELYNIKHELIAAQTKNDSLKKEFDITKEDLSNAQKQLIRLEAEIAELKKQLHKK